MANKPAFVGVPKRATCNRCSNPIFLAERISFGAKSYHRSCLKCARCSTQLTVGSFYETEIDGEYCCETCPDEEIQLEQRRESSPSSEGSGRSSIITGGVAPVAGTVGLTKNVRSSKLLDRISFFESAPLSDEEKTSNLERKTRMSNFLKETLKDVEPDKDEPPELPSNGPPSSLANSLDGKAIDDAVDSDNVDDEFEKLVEGLDEEDLEGGTNASLQPVPDRMLKDDTSDLQTVLTVSTVPTELKNDQTLALPDIEDTEVKEKESLETYVPVEKVATSNDIEEATPVAIQPNSDVLQNSSTSDAARYEREGDLEQLDVIAKVTETSESSDLNVGNQQDVIDDKQTEIKQPSEEISKDVGQEISVADVVVIVDTETLPSVVESDSPTQEPDVPEENDCTGLKISPTELTEPTENSESQCTVPNETVENTVPHPEVPVTEGKELPTESSEVSDAAENVPDSTEPDTNDEEQYPCGLNPFGEDDDDGGEGDEKIEELCKVPPGGKPVPTMRRVSTNPFGSDDEEEEEDNQQQSPSSKPPRPPPPKVKPVGGAASSKPVPANPFDEDDDDEEEPEIVPVSKPSPRRTPVPTPRKAHAYNDSISSMDNSLMSSSRLSSSNVSLASSLESGPPSMVASRRKKGKAPDIPLAALAASTPIASLQAVTSGAEKTSIENLSTSSGSGTLTTPRKKRLAPAPPPAPNTTSTPKQSLQQGDTLTRVPSQRLITVDASLLSNSDRDPSETMSRGTSNESVVYRRLIVPLVLDEDGPESPVHHGGSTTVSGRQCEKMKDNKEAQNRNRQSQSSPTSEGNGLSFGSPGSGGFSILANKSYQGKWKRRKGPAPALPLIAAPLPERKPIKMLPLKEIHQELQIIETQQQGLEKQGIVLEKMIRERCEGVEADIDLDIRLQTNSKEVEDLIMQLFELVNEKNELFRRQAELMSLRRMHRLEQEQADLEYEIRLLMVQPERNKTDSDKEKEEALIARLVEIVQLRNEVVECLEMDRIREAEEDLAIKQSIEERAASQQSKHGSSKKDSSTSGTTVLSLIDAEKRDSSTKLSKKEKKKLKEAKKLVKSKKIDSEKDADETESSAAKEKKKKRKFLF